MHSLPVPGTNSGKMFQDAVSSFNSTVRGNINILLQDINDVSAFAEAKHDGFNSTILLRFSILI